MLLNSSKPDTHCRTPLGDHHVVILLAVFGTDYPKPETQKHIAAAVDSSACLNFACFSIPFYLCKVVPQFASLS
jgi:hypothetical protein